MDYLLALAADPNAWAALVTLTAMEVVLGIDNLIFISILTNKLPEHQRERARQVGIGAALVLRLALLGTVAIIVRLTEPVFTAFGQGFSWRDLILIGGGLFLVWKATKEIHHNVDPDHGPDIFEPAPKLGFAPAIGQILLLDLVFSIDSIITAVGMTEHIPIMVVAVLFTVGVMLFAATPLANFIAGNPSLVMLALGFLLLIGTTLIAEGFGAKIPKGYIYSAMAFSALVEGLNMLGRRRRARLRAAASGAGERRAEASACRRRPSRRTPPALGRNSEPEPEVIPARIVPASRMSPPRKRGPISQPWSGWVPASAGTTTRQDSCGAV